MQLTRRDFLKASSAVAGAVGLAATGMMNLPQALAKEAANGGVPVIWLEGSGCSGCSVSLLNTVYYTTIDNLLVNTLDLDYHATVMAAAGDLAVANANATKAKGGYVLILEGAIPTGASGRYGHLWEGTTIAAGVKAFAANAGYIMAVGTCACYGGVSGGKPNPTGAKGLAAYLASVGINKPVVNIPGCPAHPDWIVGTVAYILKNGKVPTLDANGRPVDYFSHTVHSQCPRRLRNYGAVGSAGCLRTAGCRGPATWADCPMRAWNAGMAKGAGVNWCVAANSPCHGCTEPSFPDGMSPFFNTPSGSTGGYDRHDDHDDHDD